MRYRGFGQTIVQGTEAVAAIEAAASVPNPGSTVATIVPPYTEDAFTSNLSGDLETWASANWLIVALVLLGFGLVAGRAL